jgi:DNA-binding response OmpR family regulator
MNSLSTILVVEDETDLLNILKLRLETEGYQVVSEVNGLEVVPRVRLHKPNLILLDIMLPGLSGFEICKLLKQDAETRGIPIIMVTARSMSKDKFYGLECGADAYVIKPFDFQRLSALIRNHLRKG